jgi:hypothetical protein
MPNPNMTYEELQKQVMDQLLLVYYKGLDHKGFSKFEERSTVDKINQLFATFMDNLLTNAVVDKNFTKELDTYIKKVRAEFGPLTTKNTEEENV